MLNPCCVCQAKGTRVCQAKGTRQENHDHNPSILRNHLLNLISLEDMFDQTFLGISCSRKQRLSSTASRQSCSSKPKWIRPLEFLSRSDIQTKELSEFLRRIVIIQSNIGLVFMVTQLAGDTKEGGIQQSLQLHGFFGLNVMPVYLTKKALCRTRPLERQTTIVYTTRELLLHNCNVYFFYLFFSLNCRLGKCNFYFHIEGGLSSWGPAPCLKKDIGVFW